MPKKLTKKLLDERYVIKLYGGQGEILSVGLPGEPEWSMVESIGRIVIRWRKDGRVFELSVAPSHTIYVAGPEEQPRT